MLAFHHDGIHMQENWTLNLFLLLMILKCILVVSHEHASICRWHCPSIPTITIQVKRNKFFSSLHLQMKIVKIYAFYITSVVILPLKFDTYSMGCLRLGGNLGLWFSTDAQTLLEFLPQLQTLTPGREEGVAFLRRFLRRKEVQATMKVIILIKSFHFKHQWSMQIQ